MTATERNNGVGFIVLISCAVIVTLGIVNDWAWYWTTLGSVMQLLCISTVNELHHQTQESKRVRARRCGQHQPRPSSVEI